MDINLREDLKNILNQNKKLSDCLEQENYSKFLMMVDELSLYDYADVRTKNNTVIKAGFLSLFQAIGNLDNVIENCLNYKDTLSWYSKKQKAEEISLYLDPIQSTTIKTAWIKKWSKDLKLESLPDFILAVIVASHEISFEEDCPKIVNIHDFKNLDTINIPANWEFTSTSVNFIYANSNLKNVNFSENSKNTVIPTFFIKDCPSLTSITLPNSIQYINNSAIIGCGDNCNFQMKKPKHTIKMSKNTFDKLNNNFKWID